MDICGLTPKLVAEDADSAQYSTTIALKQIISAELAVVPTFVDRLIRGEMTVC